MVRKIGRALVAVGASIIWLPFAALAGLSILAFLSGPGLPAADWPIAVLSFAIVGMLPILARRALRTTGVTAISTLAVVGVAIPLLWLSLLRPDYSAPLHWIAWVTILGGSATAVGGLLMIARPASGPGSSAKTG
jgi:hypothetical protein